MENIIFDSGAKGEVSLGVIGQILDRQTATMLAILQVQQELLQAVREMQPGDDAIGSAISRYRQKWAVVNGGLE